MASSSVIGSMVPLSMLCDADQVAIVVVQVQAVPALRSPVIWTEEAVPVGAWRC